MADGLRWRRWAMPVSAQIALLCACHAPATTGVYAHRAPDGAVILHLAETPGGRVEGDLTVTRRQSDGGMRIAAHRLAGPATGADLVLHDAAGRAVRIALDDRRARVTAPDGSVTRLARTDANGESAVLRDLANRP